MIERVANMKILIFRSCTMTQFEMLLQKVQAGYPGAEIHVVGQPAIMDALETDARIQKTFNYDRGFFNIFRIPFAWWKSWRRNKYDCVIVPWNNPEGKGTHHLNMAAKLAGTKNILVHRVSGELITYDKKREFSAEAVVSFINDMLDFLCWTIPRMIRGAALAVLLTAVFVPFVILGLFEKETVKKW